MIVDIAEMQQVQPGPRSEFRIGASPNANPAAFRTPPTFAINEAAQITAENTGAVQMPAEWGFVARPPASIVRVVAQETACSTHNYGANCAFGFEFTARGAARWIVAGANLARAEIVPRT
jgi:hypothetical protein